jgi:flagellin-like protein
MTPDSHRAIAPVVGVALMLAITVTFGATVGLMMTEIEGEMPDHPPEFTVSFDFRDTPHGQPDEVVLVHEGGEAVDPTRLRLVVRGAEAYDGPGESGQCPVVTRDSNRWSAHGMGTTGDVTAGDTATATNGLFETAGGAVLPADACDADGAPDVVELNDATLRLVWVSPEGDDSFVVATWSGPSA